MQVTLSTTRKTHLRVKNSMSFLLITLVFANVATWASEEAVRTRTDAIILYIHPLPDYAAKSREELIKQYRSEHVERMQQILPS